MIQFAGHLFEVIEDLHRWVRGSRIEGRQHVLAGFFQGGGQVNVSYTDVFGKGEGDGLSVELPQGGDVKEDDAPIIRYVNSLIVDAIRRKASDIHLEPLEKRFRVRFRIDGVLQEMKGPPKRLQASIISRLKLMAEEIGRAHV